LKEAQLPGIESKRIGLRYINEFPCNDIKTVSKIFNKRLSAIIKQMINGKSQSRVIGMEEYNNDGFKIRFQYGIPNKYYPSAINVFDLVLDIDSYIEISSPANEWEDLIKILNHSAYTYFITEMNENYLEGLK